MGPHVAGWLRQRPPWTVVAIALAMVIGLGVIDYATGPEIAFSPFYLLPVAMVAWRLGMRSAWPVVLASALTWLAADLAADASYEHDWIPFWNTGARFAVFATVALLVADLQRARRLAEKMAASDGLTGIANSRTFLAVADVERRRADRYRRPLTLAYIDLDNFKRINDTYGHARGDDVLRTVAQALKNRARSSDVVARLGGDEFAVILPETDYGAAGSFLLGLRPILQRELGQLGINATCSVGSVTFRTMPDTIDEMIQLADDRMYEAKRGGKDAVKHVLVE